MNDSMLNKSMFKYEKLVKFNNIFGFSVNRLRGNTVTGIREYFCADEVVGEFSAKCDM